MSWVKVESFGDDHRVLFVSKVYSFFVSAAEFPGFELSNCIVFSNDAFRPYCKPAESKYSEEKIQIFRLGEHDGGNFISIGDFPGSPVGVFSLPSWVLQAQSSSIPSHSQSDPEENEMMESAACHQDGAPSQTHVSAASDVHDSDVKHEEGTEIPSTSAAQGKSTSHLPDSDVKHEEAPDISEMKVSAADVAPVIPSVLASQACEQNIKFQGLESLDIRSNLLSTSQIIWNKHGNLIGKNTVRSRDMLVCTLESLAKIITILQYTTPRTLTDSLAKDITSILYDLHCVSLKVDWLVPFVDRALTLHKSKPLIESIMAIDKSKAQADEEERVFLAHSARVKQELEESRSCWSARLPFPEPIDLDQCLGEGLF